MQVRPEPRLATLLVIPASLVDLVASLVVEPESRDLVAARRRLDSSRQLPLPAVVVARPPPRFVPLVVTLALSFKQTFLQGFPAVSVFPNNRHSLCTTLQIQSDGSSPLSPADLLRRSVALDEEESLRSGSLFSRWLRESSQSLSGVVSTLQATCDSLALISLGLGLHLSPRLLAHSAADAALACSLCPDLAYAPSPHTSHPPPAPRSLPPPHLARAT